MSVPGWNRRAVAAVAANDVKLTFRYRGVVFWIFLMPVVFMAFFGFAFRGRGGGGPVKARLTVENHDAGMLSGALLRELRDEPLQVVDTLAAGEDPVRTLVIPDDFTRRVLAREPVRLTLRTGAGSNAEAGQAANAAIYRCLIRIAADLVTIEAAEIDAGSPRIAVRGDSLVGSLAAVAAGRADSTAFVRAALDTLAASPRLVTVSASNAGKARAIPGGFENSVPGMLVMFVLMSMVFSGATITSERLGGVLRRYAYAPIDRGTIVAGKLAGRMVIAAIQIAFLLAVGRFAFHVSLGGSPVALVLLMLAFAFCMGAFSILFGSLLRNPEQVSSIGVLSTMIMAALGGCWWPVEIVPPFFRAASFFVPTGWAMNGMHKLLSFGYGMRETLPNLLVLAAFGLAFVALASWKLRWKE